MDTSCENNRITLLEPPYTRHQSNLALNSGERTESHEADLEFYPKTYRGGDPLLLPNIPVGIKGSK